MKKTTKNAKAWHNNSFMWQKCKEKGFWKRSQKEKKYFPMIVVKPFCSLKKVDFSFIHSKKSLSLYFFLGKKLFRLRNIRRSSWSRFSHRAKIFSCENWIRWDCRVAPVEQKILFVNKNINRTFLHGLYNGSRVYKICTCTGAWYLLLTWGSLNLRVFFPDI